MRLGSIVQGGGIWLEEMWPTETYVCKYVGDAEIWFSASTVTTVNTTRPVNTYRFHSVIS